MELQSTLRRLPVLSVFYLKNPRFYGKMKEIPPTKEQTPHGQSLNGHASMPTWLAAFV